MIERVEKRQKKKINKRQRDMKILCIDEGIYDALFSILLYSRMILFQIQNI